MAATSPSRRSMSRPALWRPCQSRSRRRAWRARSRRRRLPTRQASADRLLGDEHLEGVGADGDHQEQRRRGARSRRSGRRRGRRRWRARAARGRPPAPAWRRRSTTPRTSSRARSGRRYAASRPASERDGGRAMARATLLTRSPGPAAVSRQASDVRGAKTSVPTVRLQRRRKEEGVSTNVELRLLGPVELIGPDGSAAPRRARTSARSSRRWRSTRGAPSPPPTSSRGCGATRPRQHVRKSLSTQIARVRRPLARGRCRAHPHRRRLPARPAAGRSTSIGSSRPSARRATWPPPQLWPRADRPAARGPGALAGRTARRPGVVPVRAGGGRLARCPAGRPPRTGWPTSWWPAASRTRRPSSSSDWWRTNPYDERRWAQLVRALSAGGRRRDALLAYQRAATSSARASASTPGPELRDVERDVLAGESPTVGHRRRRRGRRHAVHRPHRRARPPRRAPSTEPAAVRSRPWPCSASPGIGKSRLLDELAARLRRARGDACSAASCEPTQTVPLRCLLAALDPWLSDPSARVPRSASTRPCSASTLRRRADGASWSPPASTCAATG